MPENRCFTPQPMPCFDRIVSMGIEMQRDDDYLRKLMQEFEADEDWRVLVSDRIKSTPDEAKRHYHITLLVDAGFMTHVGGQAYRLTNAAHDFLAMTRQDEAWEATKAVGRRLGGASLQMLYRVAEGYAKQKLGEWGVPLA